MKLHMARIFALLLVVLLLVGCVPQGPDSSEKLLNGVELIDYTIVYSPEATDYCQRAAQYIQKQILRTFW